MNRLTQQDLDIYLEHRLGNNRQRVFMQSADCKTTDRATARFTATVAALANAEGGHIIFGIALSRKKASGTYTIDKEVFNEQWIKTAIEENISPRIEHADVYSIGQTLCVTISKSNAMPHRCADRHYYTIDPNGIRSLEEYEIRQLYKKSQVPEIDIWAVQNTGGIPQLSNGLFTVVNFYPRIFIKNIGNAAETAYKIELAVPTAVNNQNFDVLQQYFSHFDNGYTFFSCPSKSPIFPNETAAIFEANLFVNQANYQYFEDGHLRIKCYYSTGFAQKDIRLKDLLLYRHSTVEAHEFTTLPQS